MSDEDEELLSDADVEAALEELRAAILTVEAGATFEVGLGDDPDEVHLTAHVAMDDLNQFWAAVGDLQFEIQIERGLPIFVIPVTPSSATPPLAKGKKPHRARP